MRALVLGLSVVPALALAQAPTDAGFQAAQRPGKSFMATSVHSQEEDRKLLQLFAGLRVADATDGMDAAGLQNVGLMDPEIRPVWKDTKTYRHRFVGLAVTAR